MKSSETDGGDGFTLNCTLKMVRMVKKKYQGMPNLGLSIKYVFL